MARTVAIIVGAGRGHRFGGETPKQYLDLAGTPVLRRTLKAFLDHPGVHAVLPVIHPDDRAMFDAAAGGLDVMAPVSGGAQRQDSVRNGLEAVAGQGFDVVLIHDAARPRVTAALIDRVLETLAAGADGALPSLAVTDTLKRADTSGRIVATVPRDGLWRAQTPQGFKFAPLLAAHRALAGEALTDDAAVAERHGLSVAVVAGDEDNIKITTPEDMQRMTDLYSGNGGRPSFRVGSGFDVHRVGPGNGVWLGGVLVPSNLALIGHSDADVALHAITDAVLGAIADGDIGSHFPPSDPKWKGASSDRFLKHAVSLAAAKGGRVENVDLTIICERPKVGPHRDEIRRKIAEIIGIEMDRVSVKATTTEQLGFTGRGEGVAANASILLSFA